MKHTLLCAALALGAILFSIPPAATAGQGAKRLELFGVSLKGASLGAVEGGVEEKRPASYS
jgi:hypothetical protein